MSILTFDDSTKLSDFKMVNLKGNELPLKGSITTRTTKVPGQRGLLDFGNELGSIVQKYQIGVLTQDPIERSYMMREFMQFLSDEYGYPRIIKVHDSQEPDVFYYAKLKTAPAPKRYVTDADFVLQIENLDGVKYAIAEASEIMWGSRIVNFQASYTLGHQGNGANELQITKNTTVNPTVMWNAVQPLITIKGSGTDVVITSNNAKIIVGTFSNATIEIDTANFIAYKNGQEAAMNMDWFYLYNNQSVSISGTGMNFKLSFHYRDEV